jgi:DNA-binding transcriptional LysR family regulator
MSRTAQSRPTAFTELNAVIAVAEHRSFRRAAAELGVSASALSHAVASLEHRLGVKLFHRTTRSVSLSEAGERFVERIRPAIREISEAMETVNAFRAKPAGTLRINTGLAAAERIFEPVVLPFLERYPDMRVDIVTEGRLVDIVASGFDAGIRQADTVPRDMVAVPCSPPIRFVVVGSPDYLARHGRPRSPADLAAHECIRRRMPSGIPMRWELEKNGEPVELDVRGALTLDATELMIKAALNGVGLAWVNEWNVETLLAEKRLVRVLDDWCPAWGGLCLYYPPHRHVSAGLRAFVELLRGKDLAGRRARRKRKR